MLISLFIKGLYSTTKKKSKKPQDFYEKCILNQVQKILGDQTHFLYPQYELLPSGRRYRVSICKLNRHKNSFASVSVRMFHKCLS